MRNRKKKQRTKAAFIESNIVIFSYRGYGSTTDFDNVYTSPPAPHARKICVTRSATDAALQQREQSLRLSIVGPADGFRPTAYICHIDPPADFLFG